MSDTHKHKWLLNNLGQCKCGAERCRARDNGIRCIEKGEVPYTVNKAGSIAYLCEKHAAKHK